MPGYYSKAIKMKERNDGCEPKEIMASFRIVDVASDNLSCEQYE